MSTKFYASSGILLLAILLQACDWASEKARKTVNKTGEVVAKTGAEFADGIKQGIEESFENKINLSDKLIMEGVTKGKIQVLSSDSATDHILSVYLIFEQNLKRRITVKLYTSDSTEYGRTVQEVNATKGEARYIDFVFDKRTQIDKRGTITIE